MTLMTEGRGLIVNLIALRHGHHAAQSGYARMVDFLEANVITTDRVPNLWQRGFTRVFKFAIKRSGSQWYHRSNFLAECSAAWQWMRGSNQIFHFLYGENSYRYLGNLKRLGRNHRIVCTYHTPPERFGEIVHDRHHLRHLDAVIVFSSAQMNFFTELLGYGRVFYIPHGVDVDYFQPTTEAKQNHAELRCLFVGQHLRDFETLATAARHLESTVAKVRFLIVTPKHRHHHFHGLGNVELYSAISDAALLTLYQQSDLFVFPLLDTTANCAVQEAMACGLPIVATDLAGIRDYVDESCALLTPRGDAQALVDAILNLHESQDLRIRMGTASRTKALDCRLESVAAQTMEVYRQLGNDVP